MQPSTNKTYPIHRDPHQYVWDEDAAQFEYDDARSKGVESIDMAFEDVTTAFPRTTTLYRKQRPNYNDPMTLYYLLTALIETKRGVYIRPAYLVGRLEVISPQWYWDVVMVGRMLAGIWEVCSDSYLDQRDSGGMQYVPTHSGDGEPIPDGIRLKNLPFALGRDSRGKYYVIDPQNGNEGLLWLLKFRLEARKRSVKAMQSELEGDLGFGMGKAVVPSAIYQEWSPDPVRSAQNYRASQKPGKHFVTPEVPVVNFYDAT